MVSDGLRTQETRSWASMIMFQSSGFRTTVLKSIFDFQYRRIHIRQQTSNVTQNNGSTKIRIIQSLPGDIFYCLNIEVACHLAIEQCTPKWGPGTHFANDFSIAIQIRWKFHSALIQVVVMGSLQNFAHGMTALLSWHVHNIIAKWYPSMELHYNNDGTRFNMLHTVLL